MGLAYGRKKVVFKRRCLPGEDALQLCPASVWRWQLCIHHPCPPICATVFVEMKPKHKGWSAPGLTANHLWSAVYTYHTHLRGNLKGHQLGYSLYVSYSMYLVYFYDLFPFLVADEMYHCGQCEKNYV